jgi:hypothetical protein
VKLVLLLKKSPQLLVSKRAGERAEDSKSEQRVQSSFFIIVVNNTAKECACLSRPHPTLAIGFFQVNQSHLVFGPHPGNDGENLACRSTYHGTLVFWFIPCEGPCQGAPPIDLRTSGEGYLRTKRI